MILRLGYSFCSDMAPKEQGDAHPSIHQPCAVSELWWWQITRSHFGVLQGDAPIVKGDCKPTNETEGHHPVANIWSMRRYVQPLLPHVHLTHVCLQLGYLRCGTCGSVLKQSDQNGWNTWLLAVLCIGCSSCHPSSLGSSNSSNGSSCQRIITHEKPWKPRRVLMKQCQWFSPICSRCLLQSIRAAPQGRGGGIKVIVVDLQKDVLFFFVDDIIGH